eukprot:TRINITY_DN1889_c0_g1_i1.p1 TRINITY_DN1889_c0_g1~~TRINITY_DN1889_c0_g1_i1.p1  ORF type:complete len:460 (+),score=139.79 TRINITY_DN1889_c0_g1_i1:153-1532(+)
MRSIFAALAMLGVATASDVVVGEASNWKELSTAEGIMLAEFYAPWCGHCKKLAPEWETAATELKGQATLVKVDATIESDLAQQYGIQGYPTIKAFMDGEMSDYEGGRTSADIVSWVKKMSGPAVKDIEDAAGLAAFQAAHDVVSVGFFESADSDDAKAFAKLAKQKRADHVFGAVYSADIAKAEGVTAPGLVVYKTFDTKKDVAEKFDAATAIEFIQASSFRLFAEIGPDNYKSYVDRGLPLGWLFVDPAADNTQEAKDAVAKVAESVKGKISMVWLSGVQYGQMAGRVGLSGKVWPSFGIDDNGEHFAFDESKSIASEDFAAWVADWAAGKLEPTVKSEEAPENPTTDGLTVLVGSTFKEIVFDEKKDVFIKFYAPWCGHCKSMIPDYEALAKNFEGEETVVIAKMDATANDAPKGFDVQGFPTLMFVPAGSTEIMKFEGGRNTKEMEDYIRKNAKSL